MVESTEPDESETSYYTVDHKIDEIKLRDTQEFYATIDKLNKTYEVSQETDRTLKESKELDKYNRALSIDPFTKGLSAPVLSVCNLRPKFEFEFLWL